jgi:RHS repeat-associated protein
MRPWSICALMFAVLGLAGARPAAAQTAEICGNGVDDNGNGFADEGCYPGLSNPLVDSPLPTSATGLISPSRGALYYPLPPDISFRIVLDGLGPLEFRRRYLSMHAPGGAAPAYRKPMGDRWTHNWSSWIDDYGTSLVIHLPSGQEIVAVPLGSCLYETRGPVAVKRLWHCPGGYYEIETLDRTRMFFSPVSFGGPPMLYYIYQNWHGFHLAYNANNQVIEVSDSGFDHHLKINYTNNLVTSVERRYQTTTYHTTSYTYSGQNLASVTIGGQLAQQNVYTNNYLTQIQDGAGTPIVSFAYDSSTPGKAVRVDTTRGMVGFEYAASRTGCSGSNKTVLYFNRGNNSSCSVDSDCGTGFLCGGKTGAGSTGQCFRAARCLTIDLTPGKHEELVTSVSALGPPGEQCEGACIDVSQYLWDNATRYVASLGIADPSGNYTVRALNSNGLPTEISFGDPDSNPSNGNSARVVWLKYGNAAIPGAVTEIRRKSDLHPQAALCSPTAGDACQMTFITWDDNSVRPIQVSERGFTLNEFGQIVEYNFSTTYSYDSGRISQIDGPLPGSDDVTQFEYWPGGTGDPLKDYRLKAIKRKKDGANFVTTTAEAYDFRGNPIALKDADGTFTCLTFDTARGHLTERREAMAGQTSCANPNGADLVTSWVRDSAQRLTRVTRPDGSCMHYEYDAKGRLLRTKRRDDCNAGSSGDRQEYLYDAEGLVTEVQTYDASNTLTHKQPYTYYDSRKLHRVVNPVNTSTWTGLTYDDRGLVTQVDAAGGLGKTVFNRDGLPGRDGRVTSVDRYNDVSVFDSWNLLYAWLGGQVSVEDGDSKKTETVRDDLGRVVKLVSPDKTHPTLYVYNQASHMVKMIEAFGSGAPLTHNFTYDHLGRPLTADYHGTCDPTGAPQNEIEMIYDGLPVSFDMCPTGMSCTGIGGRLAYVKTRLMCTTAQADGSIDQETFFQYDGAGRVIREWVQDDVPAPNQRIADHQYAWTKNGALAQVTLPSGAVHGWTYGSGGNNSDTDRVAAVWRTNTGTPIIDQIQWNPYGPLKQYNQKNQISNNLQRTRFERNLAYRITDMRVERQAGGGTPTWRVTLGEDAKGRVIKRDYSNHASGVQDSYFLYDHQDRLICETTNSVSSCPTSGTNIKNSRVSPYFTAAGDWQKLLRPVPGSTGGLTNHFNPTGYGSSHQVTMVRQNDGSPQLGDTLFAFDARGNRIWDDNQSTLTNDHRSYTYDSRGNVINVQGEYYSGGTWRTYDVASAFDAKNRRVFKSFRDASTGVQAHWFFYYDAVDRLTEVRYTPNISSPSTYSLFHLSWLGDRLVHYWQTDYPSVTTSRRYVGTDETGRPLDMWTWPASGNGSRVWAVNPSAWGFDTNLVGPTVFQPVLFAGQYVDRETAALANNGTTVHRPGVVWNAARTYDPFTGGYLQVDPLVPETWSSYGYADSDPVGKRDPSGLGWVRYADGTAYYCSDKVRSWDSPEGTHIEGGSCTYVGWFPTWTDVGGDPTQPPTPPGGKGLGGWGGSRPQASPDSYVPPPDRIKKTCAECDRDYQLDKEVCDTTTTPGTLEYYICHGWCLDKYIRCLEECTWVITARLL